MQYEYRLVPVAGASSVADLDAAGAEGFEAVGMSPLQDGTLVVLLKRASGGVTAADFTTATSRTQSIPAPAEAPPADAGVQAGPVADHPVDAVHPTLVHHQWDEWLRDAAAGSGPAAVAAATFWDTYEASGSPADLYEISALAISACRMAGVSVPDFAQ